MTHPNPVPDAEIEAVALVILKSQRDSELNEFGRALNSATAAIAVLTPLIERDVSEQCAAIAERYAEIDSDISTAHAEHAEGVGGAKADAYRELAARHKEAANAADYIASAIRSAFHLPSPVGGE